MIIFARAVENWPEAVTYSVIAIAIAIVALAMAWGSR